MATIFAGAESGNLGFVFDKGDTRYDVIISFEARDKSILVLDEIDSSGQILHDIRRGLRVRGARQGFKKIVAKRSLREPLIQVSDLIAGVVHRWKQ